MTCIISTARLELSELTTQDAAFIYQLFTDSDCLRFIGDRGISDIKSAAVYLADKLIPSYQKYGYGLFKVTAKNNPQPFGLCGLVLRAETKPPDIGFAFLPEFRAAGHCTEAAQAVLKWVKSQQLSDVILAYTHPDNKASIRVLEKIGLQQQYTTQLPNQDFASLVLSINLNLSD